MAKKKKPQKNHDEDESPRRVGDATEIDLSLQPEAEAPAADPVSDVDFDLLKPTVDPAERTIGASLDDFPDLADDARRVGDVTEATYDDIDLDVPTASASASSSNLFGTGVPTASAADSEPNLEAIAPVQPASGWFDSDADEPAPKAVPTDAIDAVLAEPPTGPMDDASDIFAGPVPPALPKSDVSDVIAATAYSPARPVDPEKKKLNSRASDVALNFDRPPGGSTIESLSAAADLPEAEEAPDSLFGEATADSSQFAKVPKLPDDAPDFGATPASSIDASSILADLSEPGSAPGDSSAIRLESPGLDATLRAEADPPKFTRDSTELDMDLPEGEEADPTDWRSQSGSDLFGTKPEFELTPDMGKVDPFGDDLEVDQPSLSSAPSSIFSGGKPPQGSGSGTPSGGSVPVANPDSTADAVEFSDHPDPNAADSGSFHVLPAAAAGAVDFDIPESDDPHPERTMRAAIPEDEDDWTTAQTDPGPGASGILSSKMRQDPTDEMAPLPASPLKGKPEKKAEDARVVAWAEDGEEVEKAVPRRREPQPEPASKRGLAGLALGLLLGVGASAGAYFSGVLPNQSGVPSTGVGAGTANTELQTKLDAALADLSTAKTAVTKAEKDAADEKGKVAKLEGDVRSAQTATQEAEKKLFAQTTAAANLKAMADTLAADLRTEKEKTLDAEKLAAAEKDKAVLAEKALTAEKEKLVKAEKDLKAEKDITLKVEKDLKGMLDKLAADSKKDLDAAKTELTKAQDALKLETADKTKLADAVKARQATVDAIAKELQAAKLLSDKYDEAALVAAAKSSASRATGPDLSKLIPAELSSVAGTGLSTGHILDLAARTKKADEAVKLSAKEISELKAEHTAEVKSLTDLVKKTATDLNAAHAVELKKAADASTVAMDKLKIELKKATDATAAEVKKATDAAAVAMEKLKADQAAKLKEAATAHAAEVKSLEDAVATEKGKTAEAERRFKALGGAATLAAQELDRQSALSAARNLDLGIAEYKAGRYVAAIAALQEAAKHDPNDPVSWYYLGATRWAQGKPDDARVDFKKGADREALRSIPARQIDAMIGSIQGPARDALSNARP